MKALGNAGSEGLARLAEELRAQSWHLAVEAVDEGVAHDRTPSLARASQFQRLGSLANLIVEISSKLTDPWPARLTDESPLALLVHAHAHQREALGAAPREIVAELLTLRRVVWRFLLTAGSGLPQSDLLEAERRLSNAVDQLVSEAAAVAFERATSELADRARHDPLTRLLNRQTFLAELDLEIARAERYGRELALVFLDCDRLKQVNDRFGHAEGDRVLQRLAELLRAMKRTNDVAGRLAGDEFAVVLLEAEFAAGERFLARLLRELEQQASAGRIPRGFSISGGAAYYPKDGRTAASLFEVADARLYERKREQRRARPNG